MKNKGQYILSLFLIFFISSIVLFPSFKTFYGKGYANIKFKELINKDLSLSGGDNKELLDSLFNSKVLEYYDKGFLPQIYEPSLQATYYALFTLQSIGKLHEINHTEIIEYIMGYFEEEDGRFMDILAYRYLDTDFTKTYFPLSTILEITCYAVLSLNLLDALHLVDNSNIINFIWSCYNPISGGFIGQPYDFGLDDGFKIATADNTYFAVITLNLLMDDWLGYSTEKNNIISFINGLQVSNGMGWTLGGFENDEEGSFNSLFFHFEPNLLASYNCIKTLEVFNMVSSINDDLFHQFLNNLYNAEDHYFRVSEFDFGSNYTNIVATAVGFELANITSFTEINRTEILSFIFEDRNSLGNWDHSTSPSIHELIDTYQIIRSLNNTKEIPRLTSEDINQIGNATLYYQSYQGFSLLSEDYTSMKLLYTITGSFELFDKISELDIQQLYKDISGSYLNFTADNLSHTFYGFVLRDIENFWFRSCPIEYYTSGHKNYIQRIEQINSHQSTYYGLQSLKNLFKLDDFASTISLIELIDDIVATQFLNASYYDTFGAFSYLVKYSQSESEFIHSRIYCDYSYYAIKCLEILTEYLGISLDDTGIDIPALYTYIERNMIETSSTLYFNPKYSNDIETILKTTYYMTYVLHSLDLYNKDSYKIKNYIEANLNYSNIKNIYYSYKLSELLGLEIEFDFQQIHTLVPEIYSEELDEFYLTPDNILVDPDIFLWICDMARTSQIGIDGSYTKPCPLGEENHIEVLLYNLILRDFGPYITFKFESDQLGSYVFTKLGDNSYTCDIPVPMTSDNYPTVEGYLRAYEGTEIKAESYICFSTNYTLDYNVESTHNLTTYLFEVNASISANGEYLPISLGSSFMKVYRNGEHICEIEASQQDLSEYSTFHIEYSPQLTGEYTFDLYLNDGISGSILLIESLTHNLNKNARSYDNEVASAIPLSIIFIAVPGIMIVFSTKKLNKSKRDPRNS
jgi:prenyltransferase beta subunit